MVTKGGPHSGPPEGHPVVTKGVDPTFFYTPKGRDPSYFGLFSILGSVWLSFNALRGCLEN